MFAFKEGYAPLPQSSSNQETRATRSYVSLWTLLGCLLCTGVSVLTIVIGDDRKASAPSCTADYTKDDIASLRWPSQFMGFDNLKRPLFNERRTLINYPAVVMQIDQDAQAVIFDDDPKRYMARIGTISPEDRQIRVTRSVSTIVQFRVLDYGMEWCDLQLTIPLNSDDSVQICDGNMALAIHRLNASSLLNGKKLGYKARPARVSKIAEIELSKMKDVDFRRRVSCRMGEVLTFEIVHSSVESDCYVEWWQDPDKSTTAVYVVQHSTA